MVEKNEFVSIHKLKLRFLAIEMFKLERDMVLTVTTKIILETRQNRSNLRNNPSFTLPLVKSAHEGLESLCVMDPKMRKILSVEIKQTKFLLSVQFKGKFKKWNSQNRLCKLYLQHVVSTQANSQYEELSFP